jgi:hypothetical protein
MGKGALAPLENQKTMKYRQGQIFLKGRRQMEGRMAPLDGSGVTKKVAKLVILVKKVDRCVSFPKKKVVKFFCGRQYAPPRF